MVLCIPCLQESAKYAHSLFQNSVTLYGRSLRVDYSPQGNPEPRTVTAANAMVDAPAAPPHGSLAAAGGGFIIKRKNRNADALTSLPAVQSAEGSKSSPRIDTTIIRSLVQ